MSSQNKRRRAAQPNPQNSPKRAAGAPAAPAGGRLYLIVIAAALAVALLVVVVARWPSSTEPGPPPGPPPGGDARGAAAETPVRSSSGKVIDDPEQDGWDSEAFAQQAKEQLGKVIAGLDEIAIAPNETPNTNAFSQVLADGFTCAPLRPAELESVFQDGGLVVRRPAGKMRGAPVETRRGTAGLARSLVELAASLAPAEKAASHVKVFRVEMDGDSARTDVLFDIHGESAESRAEIHSVWECRWSLGRDGKPPLLESIKPIDYEESVAGSRRWRFNECTAAALDGNPCYREQILPGIDDWIERSENAFDRTRWGDQGIALGDVDGDGLEDLYFCDTGGLPNRLLLQNADGTLRDATAESGADWLDTTRGALIIDMDNDGDRDLAIAAGDVLLMENDGGGRFTLRHIQPMVGKPYSLAAADYDNDGRLDLFACGYSRQDYKVDELPVPVPYHDAANGAANVLLHNDGDWRFTDATEACGLGEHKHRWSLAAAWEDYDNDGDQDLYVANDFGKNCLYQNDGGRFRDVAKEAGVEDVGSGMSVAWGDYNHDGRLDLYVSNMFSTAGNRIAFQQRFKSDVSENVKSMYQRLAKGNTLFQSRENGTFSDVSQKASVARARWAWGSAFVDINNDSWDDIVVANGFISRQDTRDL